MCVAAPKPPKVEPIPERQPVLMPNQQAAGSPGAVDKGTQRLRSAMMIFANRSGALNAPSIAAPLGTRGM